MADPAAASTAADQSASASQAGAAAGSGDSRPSLIQSLVTAAREDRMNFIQCVGRIVCVVACALYLVRALTGSSPEGSFDLALQSFLAVSALRAGSRCGIPKFSLAFFDQLVNEDSFHYVFYCMIALADRPHFTLLFAPFVYSAIAAAQFLQPIFARSSGNLSKSLATVANAVASKASPGFQFVARSEIISFFVRCVLFLANISFSGFMNIMVFAHFLRMRYQSRRNRYPRQIWEAIGDFCETTVNKPSCPAGVRNLYHKVADMLRRVAAAQSAFGPGQQADQPQQQQQPAQ